MAFLSSGKSHCLQRHETDKYINQRVASFFQFKRRVGNRSLGRDIRQATLQNEVITPSKEQLSAKSGVVSDTSVPEGHKGLHSFLYGENNADQHKADMYEFREDEDDGSQLLPITDYLVVRDGAKPLGVYALYNDQQVLQYIGYSRNMVLAIKAHLARVGLTRCAYVRAMVFRNKAMATRTNLEAQVQAWVNEAGGPPCGNMLERLDWEGVATDAGAGAVIAPPLTGAPMSAVELDEYESKKLRMRKAMGENLHDAPANEELSAKERRLRMIAAVTNDNWSAVIQGQTEATLPSAAAVPAPTPVEAASATAKTVVSPFTQATVHRSIGNTAVEAVAPPEMTIASVTLALDEVRPYLLADGGDVAVIAVENGNVMLELQGACGTCPSSSATMKMGIERALKGRFGDTLKEVIQVASSGGPPKASVESIDLHLNMIRGAVTGLGGKVEVVSVENSVATVRYHGPKPIGNAVVSTIKEAFHDLREVKLVE